MLDRSPPAEREFVPVYPMEEDDDWPLARLISSASATVAGKPTCCRPPVIEETFGGAYPYGARRTGLAPPGARDRERPRSAVRRGAARCGSSPPQNSGRSHLPTEDIRVITLKFLTFEST